MGTGVVANPRLRRTPVLFGPVQAVAVILLLLVALSASLTMLVSQAAHYAGLREEPAGTATGLPSSTNGGQKEPRSSSPSPSTPSSDASDAPTAAPSSSLASPSASPTSTLVDINTADETQLDALPGIGPALARRIVEYRASHGRFSSVDQLLEVSGIGEKTLAKLRPLVTAS